MIGDYQTFVGRHTSFGSFALGEVLAALSDGTRRIFRILGQKYSLPMLLSRSWTLSVDTLPSEDHTFFDGTQTFTFKASPASALEVSIGSSKEEAARNLKAALLASSYSMRSSVSGASLSLASLQLGTPGNDLVPEATAASMTLTETTETAPFRRFSDLEGINYRLAQGILMRGQAQSEVETGQQTAAGTIISDAEKELREMVSGAGVLLDDESGEEPSLRDEGPVLGTYEEAEGWE